MYIGKRLLTMLSIIFIWSLTVILPLLYINNMFAYYAEAPIIQPIRSVIIAILAMSPFAWAAIYIAMTRIQGEDNPARLSNLEQMLRELNQTDLDHLQQRLQEEPVPEYESIEELLATPKRKHR